MHTNKHSDIDRLFSKLPYAKNSYQEIARTQQLEERNWHWALLHEIHFSIAVDPAQTAFEQKRFLNK